MPTAPTVITFGPTLVTGQQYSSSVTGQQYSTSAVPYYAFKVVPGTGTQDSGAYDIAQYDVGTYGS